MDARTMIRRRDGAKRAREKLGPLRVSSLQPQRALEVVQIDHTLVDLIVVDREKRQPIGRPRLTLAVDVKTRMIAGFHVSLWPPSALSVCLALTHAVFLRRPGLQIESSRRLIGVFQVYRRFCTSTMPESFTPKLW